MHGSFWAWRELASLCVLFLRVVTAFTLHTLSEGTPGGVGAQSSQWVPLKLIKIHPGLCGSGIWAVPDALVWEPGLPESSRAGLQWRCSG